MIISSAAIISTVGATLASEGWVEVRPPRADASSIAFASPEVTFRLVVTGPPDGPGSRVLSQMTSADGRALIRLRSPEDVPSGWAIDGDGVRTDATDGVPAAVLAALATAPQGESAGGSHPGLALEAERPKPPVPDTA